MEFQFELPDGYRKEDLLALCRLQYRKTLFSRILTSLLRGLLSFVGLFLLIPGLFILLGPPSGGRFAGDELRYGITWTLLGLLFLAVAIFRDRINANRSRRMLNKNMGSMHMTFTEEEVLEKAKGVEARLSYSLFLDFYRYRDWWFLYIQKHRAYVLPFSAMTAGSAENFEKFITEKTGLSVKIRK